MSDLVTTAAESRQRFLDLVADVRPELHRYCARMTGSVFDGEDVVQDTLAKAWFALAEMDATPPLRPWLFRIAHNASMDFVRRYEYRNLDADADPEMAADMMAARDRDAHEPDGDLVETALKVFAALSPVQRSALALKDVLSLSLEETADTMGLSVAAVKGALVRARANVAKARTSGAAAVVDDERLRKYALLFNARDWDGLRAMFGEETRLDVISRYTVRGPAASAYFTKYAEIMPVENLRAVAGAVAGVPVIAMFRPAASTSAAYFVRLEWGDERVAHVRDFRYVPYIGEDAEFVAS